MSVWRQGRVGGWRWEGGEDVRVGAVCECLPSL